METNSLKHFITEVRKNWGPLNSDRICAIQNLLAKLAKASPSEPWLADLLSNPKDSVELHRDLDHGFMLLAHTEKKDLYRRPHNHGDGWVMYVVQSGEMVMSTYKEVATDLVQREQYPVLPGQVKVYLPGDIHDTKCISDSVLMFRFTSCDLKNEMQNGRMKRF